MERTEDTVRDMFEDQKYFFPCAGEVVSFNAGTKRIDVKPVVQVKGTDAPVLKNVPVQLLLGSGWTVDFNLSTGDKVLLIFGCHPIPFWADGDVSEKELSKPELHHAIAFPIHVSGGVTIKNSAGTISLEMTDTGVNIMGPVTATTLSPPTTVGLTTHVHALDIAHNVTLAPTTGT